MKLTIRHHLGNPNMCRVPELTIKTMPECEGGGWWMPREQAEALVRQSEGYQDTTVDALSPTATWEEIANYWKTRCETDGTADLAKQRARDGGYHIE